MPIGMQAREKMAIEVSSNASETSQSKAEDWARRGSLAAALAGDGKALGELIGYITPVIQVRAARVLLRNPASHERNVRQEVEDLVQEILLALFRDGGKALRGWDPNKGLSFKNFVGLVAERQVASILRSGKRSPWKEDPRPQEDLDRPSTEAGGESRAASREALSMLLERIRQEASPLGWKLFHLLFVDELSVAEIQRQMDMSADAVYAWRSRLRRLAVKLRQEIETEFEPSRRKPLSGGGIP